MSDVAAVVFDQTLPFRVAAFHGSIELKITSLADGSETGRLELWVVADFLTKLSWHIPISAATTETLALGAGFSLILDLANWAQTDHQLAFDLVAKVQTPLPFVPAIQVYRGGVHITLPGHGQTAALLNAPAPASADELAQLMSLVKPAAATSASAPVLATRSA